MAVGIKGTKNNVHVIRMQYNSVWPESKTRIYIVFHKLVFSQF